MREQTLHMQARTEPNIKTYHIACAEGSALQCCSPSERGDHIHMVTLNFLSSRRPYVYALDKFVCFPREAKKLNEF